MKFLQTARRKARECRTAVGISSTELLERIEKYLWEKYQVELVAVDTDVIDGGRAELRPDEGCLYYDEKLNEKPDEKLFVIAHELGHLELHPRLTRGCAEPDPVYGSMYGSAGADSLTRYNSRSREEAEANAFAAEFLCPSDEVFRLWMNDSSNATAGKLAEALGSPVFIVYSQLAEALYQQVFASEPETESLKTDEKECDPIQEEAATFTGSPVQVDAGPGTGKTKTLVRRIEYLIENGEIESENFLIVTFSNEAAAELHERVSEKFGEEVATRLTVTTFHGFGLSVLQHHGQFQNVDANACILDDAAQMEILSEIIGKVDCRKISNLKNLEETAEEIARHINFLKQRLITSDEFERILNDWQPSDDEQLEERKEKAEELLKIFKKYEDVKDQRQRLDFADLILKPIEIFRSNPVLTNKYRQKYRAVLVDEYQDVSRATAILLGQICGENNPPWVVSDKRQSIFGFCGAAPDNVDDFPADFSGTEKFDLTVNYRSCKEVVETANQLAGLMFTNNEDRSVANYKKIWRTHEENPQAILQPAISVAVANSDQAEYEGIAGQIEDWVAKGVSFKDIAVLSRRNIDVREIVLALSRRKIPAIASGVITPDGAAGDLAGIITLADKPRASLAKLAYCLGKNRFSFEIIDNVIEKLLETDQDFSDLSGINIKEGAELISEIERAYISIKKEEFKGDAFDAMCAFLFDGSDYLRRILEMNDEAERSLALAEIIAALMQAAAYRFSHRGTPPDVIRRNFAEYFRKSLANSNTPCLSPPTQKGVPAVKVMTCHAAKGLEFPCVIVAGQARSKRSENNDFQWLPALLQPKKSDDKNQIDSVLFVGATRARQMLVISYAATSSGLPRAEKRIVAPLLETWSEIYNSHQLDWTGEVQEHTEVNLPAIWGGKIERPLAARNLDKDSCSIATYLHDAIFLGFPVEERDLYPIFFTVLRKTMSKIVEHSFREGRQIKKAEAVQFLMKKWNKSVEVEHIHHDLFLATAKNYVESFASEFVPEDGTVKFFDLIYENSNGNGNGTNQTLLDLICAYQVADNQPIAIVFRPESFNPKNLRENGLLWSSLIAKKRASFVLLRTIAPNLKAKIFSGDDGLLYDYQWNTRGNNLETETAKLSEKRAALADNCFITTVKEYNCKKCPNRISCPFWMRTAN